jgi:hypothetical protein
MLSRNHDSSLDNHLYFLTFRRPFMTDLLCTHGARHKLILHKLTSVILIRTAARPPAHAASA